MNNVQFDESRPGLLYTYLFQNRPSRPSALDSSEERPGQMHAQFSDQVCALVRYGRITPTHHRNQGTLGEGKQTLKCLRSTRGRPVDQRHLEQRLLEKPQDLPVGVPGESRDTRRGHDNLAVGEESAESRSRGGRELQLNMSQGPAKRGSKGRAI